MNATNIVVLLLIGVVCANVDARQLEGVSKETKLSISISKTATNGLGVGLYVDLGTNAYSDGYSTSRAAEALGGASSSTDANGLGSTGGYVSADGENAYGYSGSGAGGQGNTNATAGSGRATVAGDGTGGASTSNYGQVYT